MSPRGGARPGAGRKEKPEGEKMVKMSLWFDPNDLERLRELVPSSEQSEFIRMALHHALDLREQVAGKIQGTMITPNPENAKEQARSMVDKLKGMGRKAEDGQS